jgi:DNA-binding beta-propeller fold protein YncE
MWGAFGAPPPSTPMGPPLAVTKPPGSSDETGPGSSEFRSVHGVELAPDGTLYVSDRDNHRVQVFDRWGHYQNQVFIHRNSPFQQTATGLGISPDQRWLYVLDGGNSRMLVLDRKTLATVADIGGLGTAPGQMNSPHLMAVDSTGAIYIAEVLGWRVQKLTPKP